MTRKSMHEPRSAIAFDIVPTRSRADGWTAERQRAFIDTLAVTGSLRAAAASVNMSEGGAIALRKRPGAESFAAAWDAAISAAAGRIREVMVDHALNGVPNPVFFAGKQVGEKRLFHLRTQQWLLERGDRLAERHAAARDPREGEAARARVMAKLEAIARSIAAKLAETWADPEQRFAWELLNGPVPDHGDAFLAMGVSR